MVGQVSIRNGKLQKTVSEKVLCLVFIIARRTLGSQKKISASVGNAFIQLMVTRYHLVFGVWM